MAQIAVWLNLVSNALGRWLLAPLEVFSGCVSCTIIAALLGLVSLIVYKYTSPQKSIRRVRDDITAHLLALKLFPDSLAVTFRIQGRIIRGALALLMLSLPPTLVMVVPMVLVLAQMAPWYQQRPLRVGEETVVTMQLSGDPSVSWPEVKLEKPSAAEVLLGPVRINSRREVCWSIKATENGYQHLQFQVGNEKAEKDLSIGDGFMRCSARRPGWDGWDILMQPLEPPFRPGSAVRSISVGYPERVSWTSGTDWWLFYCFAASMFFALCFRAFIKVEM
jgi:uncharacterized membrane protein (DUF106 family)